MMPPQGQQQQQSGRTSLEAEPVLTRKTEQAPPAVPQPSAETAGEKYETGTLRTKGESVRGRVDVRLDTLSAVVRRREYKEDSPELITSISFSEKPEKQREKLNRLADVSIIMLANIFDRNPGIDFSNLLNFSNISSIREYLRQINPLPAENAAFNKLLQIAGHPESEVSKDFTVNWLRIVQTADLCKKEMQALRTADLRRSPTPERKKTWGEKAGAYTSKAVELFRKHPIASSLLLGLGALGIFRCVSRLIRGRSDDDGGGANTPQAAPREGGLWNWIKRHWLISTGIGLLGILGLGRGLGIEGVKKFLKDKFGWNIDAGRLSAGLALLAQGLLSWPPSWEKIKQAFETFWKGADENHETHQSIADIINQEMHSKVSGRTLFQIKDQTYEEFMSSTKALMDKAGAAIGKANEGATGWIRRGFTWVLNRFLGSKEENEALIAVRKFLEKHDAAVRRIIPIRTATTVDEVLKKLYAHITGKPVGAPTQGGDQSGAGSAAASAAAAGGAAAIVAAGELLSSETDREKQRDDARAKLTPESKKTMALENENILGKKIKAEDIKELQKRLKDRKTDLERELKNNPAKRQEITAKLAELEKQQKRFDELLKQYIAADETYLKALQDNASEEEIGLKFEKLIETKEAMEKFYEELSPTRRTWAPLPLFLYRYARIDPRKRAAFREQIRRVGKTPRLVTDELRAQKDPVGYFQEQTRIAEKELTDFESKHTADPIDDLKPEHHARKSKVHAMKKRLAYEQIRKAPGKTAAEILEAQKKYLRALNENFNANIQFLKKIMEKTGASLSEREKIAFFYDIQEQRKLLRRSIKDYQRSILEAAEQGRLPKDAAKRLVEELDTGLHSLYRKTVKEELSIWNKFFGESKGLRKQFAKWLKEEEAAGLVKFIKRGGKAGRYTHVGILGLCLAPSIYGKYKDIKETNPDIAFYDLMADLGLEAGQLLADVCPFTFGASDWYTVWTGKEVVTKRDVKGWNRYSRVIWGTLGALLDTATLIPAINVGGAPANAIMRAARAANKAAEGRKIIRAWPRIKSVAERLGGWKKFAQHLKDFKAGKGMDKARATAGMVRTAAPRVAATVLIGEVAYGAVYTMDDDANDPGIQMDTEVVKEIETQAGGTNPQTQPTNQPAAEQTPKPQQKAA